MNALHEQQQALQRAIVEGGAADLLVRAPLLRIYRHAYVERLVGALRDNFGCLPQVMGDEAFAALARAYVATHPSRWRSIRWFGDGLAAFMTARADLVPHPALVDLARMEWALRGAFDAADASALSPQVLASLPADDWPALVFTVLPSVHLLALHWAVEPLWRAMQGVAEGEEPELPEPQAHAHALLVWRAGLDNRWRSIDATNAALLRAVIEGRCFAELCTIAAERVGNDSAAATVVVALQGWLADGLLSDARPGLHPGYDV
ncbi:MAG TPA: DNA-binding domain-containing protein [Albitalea sp.]|uniref:DNA-binding domain-containing protein n=1 Tax=Piscinibacter sp. TaxID=1903157 RepID=UPI002ED242A0